MAAKNEQQTAMDEREVDDAALLKALEDREIAKGAKAEASKKYTTMDNLAKGLINNLGLNEDEPIRVGRFRVVNSAVEARSVAFDTEPTTRLSISTPSD